MAGSKVLGVRYRIEEPPIGQGGMGVVYKAFDNVTKRFVALKTVRGTVDHSSIEMFEKEWTLLSRLSHPNIVDILDIGEFSESGQQKPYFVMPLLPGTTLDKLIKMQSQRLTPERTIEIVSQACRGLQAAHDYGLVHRDLKPSNLFVMDDDTVKIIDFGVVHLSDTQTATGIKGTLQYMAPEQLEMKPTTPMSDIFSLGVVCYEALTGRKPFERSNETDVIKAIRSHVPPPASELNLLITDPVSRTVHKAMAKQPYHRFSSAREFAETLQKALRHEHIDLFDPAKIQPRINRIKKALGEGDDQFALEILTELESEGNIDAQISVLRIQVEQAIRGRTIRQLLEGARTRMEEEEYPLALQKVQSVLDIDPTNVDALSIKTNVERQRSAGQINRWSQIARQHLENQLFSKARQAAEEMLKIDHTHKPARELLAEINRGEQETGRVRQEKQQLYESALTAYRNGEISSALTKLERMLELGKKFPGHPNTDAQHQAFYNQIRSERDELHNCYAESRKALETLNYARALQICSEVLTRRPGEPMFQSLKIEVEQAQRQANSAAVAQLNGMAEAEADLDRKLAILNDAIERFPDEQLFQHSMKLVKERRTLVNSIVERARVYEEQGQYVEALGQWDILRNIYGQYPGLDHEFRRVERRREEHAREEAKATWVEKIDRALVAGRNNDAREFAETGLREFPGDGELIGLQQQSEQAAKRSAQAESLVEQAQEFSRAQNHAGAIEKLREARRCDEKNPHIPAALGSALVDEARSLAAKDWRAAVPYIEEALQINAADPGAKNASLLVEDARRRELVERCLMEARELQAAGKLEAALAKIEQGLREHPNDIRLARLSATLRAAIDNRAAEAQKRQAAKTEATVANPPTTANPKPLQPESREAKLSSLEATALFSVPELVNPASSPSPEARKEESPAATAPLPVGELPQRKRRVELRERSSEGESSRKKLAIAAAAVVVVAAAAFLYYYGGIGAKVKTPAATQANTGAPVKTLAAVTPPAPSGDAAAPAAETARVTGNPGHAKAGVAQNAQNAAQAPAAAAAQNGMPVMFHFTSSPAKARVLVDDSEDSVCYTPCYLSLSDGSHTLTVSAANYAVSKRVIRVPEQTGAFIPLEALTGNAPAAGIEDVQFDSVPTGASIFVDGLPKGHTPAALRLPAGSHQVRMVNDAWKHEEMVDLKPGGPRTFTFTLGP